MRTILILVTEGVLDSSLAITLDTLKTGGDLLARAGKKKQMRVLTAGNRKFIQTRAGLRLTTDMTLKAVTESRLRPDWVIVPGSGMTSESQIAAQFAGDDGMEVMRLLRLLGDAQVNIGASCASVFLLAQAGLLSGRSVTMTWWLARVFRSWYPDIKLDETKMLVRDGNYLTAGSAFSQVDLVLAIVTDTMGASIAQLCARYLLIDQRPSQARYMIPTHIQHIDATVIAAERWVDAHLSMPISVTALSSRLAVSPKTLARRIQSATGVSPVKFIQRRKLLHAVHLIETTPLSIEAVAEKVGYQDGTALRKLVKREFGTTPRGLR